MFELEISYAILTSAISLKVTLMSEYCVPVIAALSLNKYGRFWD